MKKRILTFSLVVLMLFGITAMSATAYEADREFGEIPNVFTASDRPSQWAETHVFTAIVLRLVSPSLQRGYTLQTTRAEFCVLAVTLYELYTSVEITGRGTFVDTNDVYVEKAAAINVVQGYDGGVFIPDKPLTREEAATMLSRLAREIGKPLQASETTFHDYAQISDWAVKEVGQVQAAGIMNGYDDNTFGPKDPYTREQSIVTMLRLYFAIITTAGEPEKASEPEPPPSTDLTEASVYASMIALKDQYPEGMRWTNSDSYTAVWKSYDNNFTWHVTGLGCHAFALILSDTAFGDLPFREHTNFDNIRVGDLLRIDYDTHTVVVLGIDGNRITIAEGNFNASVRWGRVLTLERVKETGVYVISRWP